MENKFDVFISFKHLNKDQKPTKDSVLAEKIYHFFNDNNLNTFFSKITLEQLGESNFQNAIYEALDSAKVMIVVGTSVENITSSYVKHEWESFQNDINNNKKPDGKIFIYNDGINPDQLPLPLRHHQVFLHDQDSMNHMFNFVVNALDKGRTSKRIYNTILSFTNSDYENCKIVEKKLADNNLSVCMDPWIFNTEKNTWISENQSELKNFNTRIIFIGKSTPVEWYDHELKRSVEHQKINNEFRVIPIRLPGSPPFDFTSNPGIKTVIDFEHDLEDAKALHSIISGITGKEPGILCNPDVSYLLNESRMNKLRSVEEGLAWTKHLKNMDLVTTKLYEEIVTSIVKETVYRTFLYDNLRDG